MPRLYTVSFSQVAVSAPQDLAQIPGVSNKLVRILRFWLSPAVDTSLAAAQGLSLRCRILPATFTVGSGGSTGLTPSKKDQGDAASSISTAATNNTVKATTSGTAVILFSGGAHLYSGIDKRFDSPVPIVPTAGFVLELLSTPTGTVTLSGGVDLSEEG